MNMQLIYRVNSVFTLIKEGNLSRFHAASSVGHSSHQNTATSNKSACLLLKQFTPAGTA